MKLDEYLKAQSGADSHLDPRYVIEIDALAKRVGTKPIYLQQLIRGHRKAGPEMLVGIPIATSGKVSVEDLRPDLVKKMRKLSRLAMPKPLRNRAAA